MPPQNSISSKRDFRKEFTQVGRDQVRSDLMYGRYDKDKAREARVWLEQTDAEAWQKGHVTRDKEPLLRNKKLLKAVPFVGAGALVIFTLARWLH